jgi:dihydroorotate dehydrogenase electron transfer subunit
MSSSKQENAQILSNEEVMPGNRLIWMETANWSASARPGQFLMVRCDDGNKRLLRRPISIHGLRPNATAILFRVMGEGTHWLSQRKSGDRLDILGPLGNGFHIKSAWRNLLLVAGGMGIAPMAALASDAIATGHHVTLLLGATSADQLYPTNLLPSGIKIIMTTDDGSAGRKGVVCDILSSYLGKADAVFSCGPVPMYKNILRQTSESCPNKPIQVSLETRMGCGLGGCFSCAIKTSNGMKRVCRDGPVFELKDIDWDWTKV